MISYPAAQAVFVSRRFSVDGNPRYAGGKNVMEEGMYAIINTGGKQYQVAQGDRLRVEKLDGNVGDTVELSEVLMVANDDDIKVGQPMLEGAKVTARIVEQGKAKKILVFKKKRRKGYKVKRGHRQLFTGLEIKEITA